MAPTFGWWLMSLSVLCCGFAGDAEPVDYTGHSVLRVYIRDDADLHVVQMLERSANLQVDVWGQTAAGGYIDLQVAPSSQQAVRSALAASETTWVTYIDNVQRLIDGQKTEKKKNSRGKRRPRRGHYFKSPPAGNHPNDTTFLSTPPVGSTWGQILETFPTFSEIIDWLDDVSRSSIVSLHTIGFSSGGRPLRLVKVGGAMNTNTTRPAVWIDGGMHAREWISPAAVIYVIHSLISGYGTDEEVTKLVNTFDWYLLPVANPDGYEYSHSTDRLWRKTRRWTKGSRCRGIDPNRNWDVAWRDSAGVSYCKGAGPCTNTYPGEKPFSDPCTNTYPGERPFSEPETRAMSAFLLAHKDELQVYISIHSYMQYWLTAWGHLKTAPYDITDQLRVAQAGVRALQLRHGTQFTAGPVSTTLYLISGDSLDWAKEVAGIKYAFALELRDKGYYGFLLPDRELLPAAEETWDGIKGALREVSKDNDMAHNTATSPRSAHTGTSH